jgi:uncharacterized protein
MNRPTHFEILAKDPEKMVAFYKSVFDWEIKTWEGPQAYWLITTGEDGTPGINGALMGRNLDQAVITTVEIQSLDATLEAVTAHDGELVHGPNEIPGVGRHAYFADPEGTLFGVLEPANE